MVELLRPGPTGTLSPDRPPRRARATRPDQYGESRSRSEPESTELLGGAVGDALGAPVEFSPLAQIRAIPGPSGPSALNPGLITDDTQMTLFTAEGLIRAFNRGRARGIGNPAAVILRAYWRWLHTQGERPSGLLIEMRALELEESNLAHRVASAPTRAPW